MTTEMIKIGMQTNLPEMMKKLLNLMELDINEQLEKLMKVLPELTYLIVGSVLIFFVLVVLVPVMQVYMGTFAFSAFNV
jgi:type II secretion system protein F domain protein